MINYKKQIAEFVKKLDNEKDKRFLVQILSILRTYISRDKH